jgi:hypothetical protein
MNRQQRRAAKREAKSVKTFTMNVQKDLPDMVDAVFIGNRNHQPNGWVIVEVNSKGRACIDALFPNALIGWRAPGDIVPADWRGCEIHVPSVVAGLRETKLPLEITGGADLATADPDQLAVLLAIRVKRQGGRAAVFRDGHLEIIQRHDHAWH